jgi:hypothetical protein
MERDVQVSAYQNLLVKALREYRQRQRREFPGELQVFVNDQGIGTLTCRADASLVFASREQPVQRLELRTESGLLVGGVRAADVGVTAERLSVARHDIDIVVHNQLAGGTVKMTCQAPASLMHRMRSLAGTVGAGFSLTGLAHAAVILAALVILSDSVKTWMAPQAPAPPPLSQEDLTRLEQILADVGKAQTVSLQMIEAQQEELAKMHRTVEKISGAQGHLRQDIMTVEQRVRVVNQDLTAAKKSLAKDLASLENHNRELKERLLSGGLTVSKVMPADKPKESPAPATQLAEARREDAPQPLAFWVSFKDNTPEKSIEEWMQAIHGRRGKVNAGWQNVEVNLPRRQTADGFLESLKEA